GIVAIGKVTTVEHAADHPLRVGLGGVVVALETPWATDVYQLTDCTDRAGSAGVDVDDLDPVGQRPQCAVRGVRRAPDGDPALFRTVSVDDPPAEPGRETVDIGGCALIAVHRPQRIVGVVGVLGGGEHIRQRLSYVVRVGCAVVADVGQEAGGRELAPQHHR